MGFHCYSTPISLAVRPALQYNVHAPHGPSLQGGIVLTAFTLFQGKLSGKREHAVLIMMIQRQSGSVSVTLAPGHVLPGDLQDPSR